MTGIETAFVRLMRAVLPEDTATIEGFGLEDGLPALLAARLRAAVAVAKAAEELADASGSLRFGPIMQCPERDRLQAALDEWNRSQVQGG